jgi:plastocyanin
LPPTTTTTTLPPTTTTTTTLPPTTTTTQPPGQVQASIVDFGYTPNPINIAVGTAVRWTNNGGIVHSTTGDDWDSGILDGGQTFTYTFTEAGSFDYFCTVHPGLMEGTVNVN